METKDSEAVERVIDLEPPAFPLNTITIGGFGMGSVDSRSFRLNFVLPKGIALAEAHKLHEIILGSFKQKLTVKNLTIEDDIETGHYRIRCILELSQEE